MVALKRALFYLDQYPQHRYLIKGLDPIGAIRLMVVPKVRFILPHSRLPLRRRAGGSSSPDPVTKAGQISLKAFQRIRARRLGSNIRRLRVFLYPNPASLESALVDLF